ncbi:hypothetical protein [Cyclobacterium marinum]|uniref:Lipoprotein n=1 Tax=Cyclobacterium marinum (strain ATCC 25205 / DSM 745 / LMG 13164 / NCIMB 1802) TaxID=880070 RepID=G0J3Y7_CYCMS|nr:hypothetical protein [Cyclobacterium marinum]AEL25961.1 hypothetical protein Cycma_2219 [Cyclobacterium marinum DSM 745]MBR9778104.1 hypothetical protein [Cytophagales bacterium]
MKRYLKWICAILFVSTVVSCGGYEIKDADINKIDTSGVYISFEYLEETYFKKIPLDSVAEDFNSSDRLRIKVKKDNPEKVEILSVKKAKWDREMSSIPLNQRKDRKVYDYYSLDKKPVILGASDEYENDSLIEKLLREGRDGQNEIKLVGVNTLINGKGDIHFESAYTDEEDEIEYLRTVIKGLPKFTPPLKNGDTVTVGYLIEVPIYSVKK